MAKTISRDTPLAEITLRKYGSPQGLEKRELVRKLCLSIGLLQPGDSRDVVVDVLQVILENCKHDKEYTSTEIEKMTMDNREKYELKQLGVAPSNIRRQILRLRDLFIVEKNGNYYRINEGSKISQIFKERIEKYYLQSILTRVKEYIEAVDQEFLEKTEE
ncbi:hypothetical protein K9L67_04445 [Candidatus Woesearchaeota archaeon]|nr:hypothetical protein [Candidatus Woesearchaeota archaeon]MCF7901449.1 hypothetical protein [Candidatus Woesearchaeota archaeon]MCF8013534.1 hypothetical protein [Candidatus Woesearchaeota archaeon]